MSPRYLLESSYDQGAIGQNADQDGAPACRIAFRDTDSTESVLEVGSRLVGALGAALSHGRDCPAELNSSRQASTSITPSLSVSDKANPAVARHLHFKLLRPVVFRDLDRLGNRDPGWMHEQGVQIPHIPDFPINLHRFIPIGSALLL